MRKSLRCAGHQDLRPYPGRAPVGIM